MLNLKINLYVVILAPAFVLTHSPQALTSGYEYIAQVKGPTSSPATFCSQAPYSIVRTNPTTGKPVTGSVSAPRTFNLSSSSSSVSFYFDSKCTQKISSVVIPVGTYFINFYVIDSKSESMTITATPTASETWFEASSLPITEISRIAVIKASASDPTGISKVNFYVNKELTCTVTASPYNCSWNVPPGVGVQYQLQTVAYDPSGKIGNSSIVTVMSQ